MLSYGHSQELGRPRKPSGRERLAHAQRDVGGARRGGRWALGSGVRGTQWAEPALLQGRERNYSHSSASHPSVGHKLAETAVAHLCLATLDGARERRARRSEGRHRARRGVGARREKQRASQLAAAPHQKCRRFLSRDPWPRGEQTA